MSKDDVIEFEGVVEEVLPKVDAIIVTPVYFFDEIKDMLQKKTVCRIISLEDVIYKL